MNQKIMQSSLLLHQYIQCINVESEQHSTGIWMVAYQNITWLYKITPTSLLGRRYMDILPYHDTPFINKIRKAKGALISKHWSNTKHLKFPQENLRNNCSLMKCIKNIPGNNFLRKLGRLSLDGTLSKL